MKLVPNMLLELQGIADGLGGFDEYDWLTVRKRLLALNLQNGVLMGLAFWRARIQRGGIKSKFTGQPATLREIRSMFFGSLKGNFQREHGLPSAAGSAHGTTGGRP